jgi:hypothetical protein
VLSLYLDSKNQQKRYDVTELIIDAKITSHRDNTAGKLEFTLIKDNIVIFHEGDVVTAYDDALPMFKGYVFTKTANEKREIQAACYDQLRFLKAHDSFEFIGKNLKDIITQIANYFQLRTGYITDIPDAVPYYYHEDESMLDIIDYHMQQAKIMTGAEYVFYDSFGELTLRRAEDLLSKYVIGVESLAGSYQYKTDIDSSTYNVIKLIRPNKATGGADVYLARDNETVKRWGLLQKYEVVDENLNAEQIKEYLKLLATYHNKVFRTLSLEALGVPEIRGGSTIYVDIPAIGDININKYLIVDQVTHTYKGSEHTMSLELEVR